MPKLEMKATVAMMTTQMIQLYFLKAMSAELEELEELLLEDGVVEGGNARIPSQQRVQRRSV